MKPDHGSFYWMVDMATALVDHLNDILETETLTVADLLDALASTDLRLKYDQDEIMPGIYARYLLEAAR